MLIERTDQIHIKHLFAVLVLAQKAFSPDEANTFSELLAWSAASSFP